MFACWAHHHNHASLVALQCIAMEELQAWLTRHGVPGDAAGGAAAELAAAGFTKAVLAGLQHGECATRL